MRCPAVGARDPVDDRKAEACSSVAARLVGSAEALECVLEEGRRESGAVVQHVQLDVGVPALRAEDDGSPAVAERIVDEVAERLLQAEPVGLERRRATAFDRDRTVAAEAAGDAAKQVVGVDRLALQRQVPLLGAGQQEQVVRDPCQPVGLEGGGLDRGAELVRRALAAQGQLELGLEERERRAELVARVRDEAPLPGEPVLEAGTGRRSSSDEAEISSARLRIASIGRNAAPASA
jgi:hypothetical protein